MKKRALCDAQHCGVKVINPWLAASLAYVSSALALAVPLLNSSGADVKTSLSLTGLDFSFLSVVIFAVWILSGVLGASEKHTNPLLCVISSLGLPGLLLAILAAGQL